MVMIQVVLHYIILVDRAEDKGDVTETDQVLRGNRIPGQLGIFVVIGGDADMNNSSGQQRIYPSTGLRATCFSRGRKLISPLRLYPVTSGLKTSRCYCKYHCEGNEIDRRMIKVKGQRD
jgi:hypothetical protein